MHELRAQLHFEGLLLLITHGPEEPDVPGSRQAFFADFMTRFRAGLRAVRDGLDCVPASTDPDGLPEPRESRLHGLYIELMIAAFCNGFLRLRDVGGRSSEEVVETFWVRWEWVNKSAGLQPLLDRASKTFFCTYLTSVRDRIEFLHDEPDFKYSLVTRSLVERFINECMHYGGTTWLRPDPDFGTADRSEGHAGETPHELVVIE